MSIPASRMFISLKICMALNNSDIVEYRGLSFESLYQRKEVLNRGGVKMNTTNEPAILDKYGQKL